MNSRRKQSLIMGITLIAVVMVFMAVSPVFAQNGPQVTVLPQQLERISWSAIVAGSIVALILQVAINLLAIGIGVSSINPMDSDNSASAKTIGTEAVVAIVVSMIVSLFVGGFMAARFSGMPERTDGLLHGVMVWAVVSLVTMVLLMTTIGRFVSGIGNLLAQGLRLAGTATQKVAEGTGTVVQNVAQGAANTVRSAMGTAQDVAENAQDRLENNPQVNDLMQKRDQAIATIKSEASKIMQQTGMTPERVKAQAQNAGYQIQDAAKEAMQNPADAERIFNQTLTRLLSNGQSLASQADEQAIVDVMVQRGNVTEEEAWKAVHRWEESLRNVQQQIDFATQQTKNRVNEVRQQVENKVEDVKQDVADKARETAQATTEAISKLAFAAFVAILIGIIAAGIGGYAGTPEQLPTAQVGASMHTTTHSLHLFS